MSNSTSSQEDRSPQSKTSPTRFARRSATAVVGFLAAAVAVMAGAPSAFAMRVAPPGDDVSSPGGVLLPAHASATNAGMPGWEIAVIVAAAVVLVSVLTLAVIGVRSRIGQRGVRQARHSLPHPAS